MLIDIFGHLEVFWVSFGIDFGLIFDLLVAQPRSAQNRENREK